MKTQSSETEQTKRRYFDLRRFAQWAAKWRNDHTSADTVVNQVLAGECIARARAWRAEK